MKNKIVLLVVLWFALALTPAAVLADKKPPRVPKVAAVIVAPELSYFGSLGQRGYPVVDGVSIVDMAAMQYDVADIGFYTLSGGAFVGAAPALTLITGTCDTYNDPIVSMRAELFVDGAYYKGLFITAPNQNIVSFSLPVYGQTFAIRVYIGGSTTIGCNVLLEKVK